MPRPRSMSQSQSASRSSMMPAQPNGAGHSRMPGGGPGGPSGPGQVQGMGMGMGMNGPPQANGPNTRRMTSGPMMMQPNGGGPGPGGYRQDGGQGQMAPYPQPPHSAAPGGGQGTGGVMQMRSATAPVNMGSQVNGPSAAAPMQGQPQQHMAPQDVGQAPAPSAPAAGSAAPAPPAVTYPWSVRPLRLFAPQTNPPTAPVNPFPRYGLAVPAFPSHSGHMLIFGGLVHENTHNDLWSMDVRDCSTMQVQTRGHMPSPRVGHAAAMADRIMLMWGGDTKIRVEDKQDEALYLLDLRSQEWTSVPIQSGPVGRYGHAVCLLDSKFYVFGAFSGTGDKHVWEQANYKSAGPSPRTGHVLLSAGGVLYVFGGTDGEYHYNDVWRFDPRTGEWTELSCIGYIPVPREGHAAAMVEDTIYVFGGRDVNGKDLGDLAAFRISTSRWFMFQNMGPSPSPRSGHAMVAAHGKIFILGGEANAQSGIALDDPTAVHVLDTVKIKYPADNSTPRTIKTASEKSGYLVHDSPSKPSTHVKRIQPSASSDMLTRAASPPGQERSPSIAQQATSVPLAAPIDTRSMPRSESIPAQASQVASPPMQVQSPPQLQTAQPAPATYPAPPSSTTAPTPSAAAAAAAASRMNGPPQRPRREGDEEYRRAMSPQNTPASPTTSLHNRVASPINGPVSPPQLRNGFNPSLVGTRSPSPRLRQVDGMDRAAPPPDAFYYGRSPTNANGFSGRPGSVSSGADLVNQLKGKDGELDAARKREMAMKVILARAVQQGFVLEPEEEEFDVQEDEMEDEKQRQVVQRLAAALVRMKQEKASLQSDLLSQLRHTADKASESERLRRGALQEAAFYRAKIATLESSSFSELSRIEKERIADLERQLGSLATEQGHMQREVEKAREAGASDKQLYESALEREAESARRAEEAEEAHRAVQEELDDLRNTISTLESSHREQAERMITLNSTVQHRESERDHLRSQVDEANAAKQGHVGMIEQVQAALVAAGARSAEIETSYNKATERIAELEADLADARAEAEARSRDADLAAERYAEVERAYATSREEADALRTATSSRLAELLDTHRENSNKDTTRGGSLYQDQVRTLEEEGKSLRKMLREAGQRLEDAEAGVSHHRSKTRELETAHQALKGELRAVRAKHAQVQQDLVRNRDLHSAREGELRDRDAAVTEIETRCTVLRNILAEHGIAVADADLDSAQVPTTSQLEKQLRDRTRAYETSQREVEELSRRCAQAEDQVESLGRLVERIKDARSPTSMSMRSPSPSGDASVRMADAERKMAEMENQHKEKMAALEGDYQTAVRYVKGTEKMLKRMKDELNKQKQSNTSLQTEIDQLRGRPSEAGARTRDASGRSTPGGDGETSRRLATLQSQHSALQAELQASRDVLTAREREVDIMRMRVEAAEREVENLRDELAQAQHRISTLLEMGGGTGFGIGDDNEDMRSEDGSEEASMAFDKFTKELKQWERSRSPTGNGRDSEDEHPMPKLTPTMQSGAKMGEGQGRQRSSSNYSGQWAQ